MTLDAVLTAARQADIRLEVQGDSLVVDAPVGVLTPELRAELLQHKPALLAILTPVTEFVSLKGGLTLPLPAFQLALDLEQRGILLATDSNHQFLIPNDARLTPADLAAIQRWKHHLGTAVEYQAPEVG